MAFDKIFWENRYKNNQTGWDIGRVSPALADYFTSIENRELHILIPGCGNAYEAEYLFHKGFHNVFVCDLAEEPLINFSNRVPHFNKDHLIHADFFELHQKFDLIVEQTFFCALEIEFREAYFRKMFSLLKSHGILAGLFFNRTFEGGPPFGGNLEEYRELYVPLFDEINVNLNPNSIAPRKGKEVFLELKRKNNHDSQPR